MKLSLFRESMKCNFQKYVKYKYSTYLSKIALTYKPRDVEKNIVFKENENLSSLQNSPKFTMILPPPNVTGSLHLGHTLMCVIQDVTCRWKKQQGYEVTWVPGVDHAGIATQVVVEKILFKEKNLNRHELGRKKFLEEVWKWKAVKTDNIYNDLKQIGCILNWEKQYFTMDKVQENAVNEAFIKLFDEGLIVRKNALVNWSCSLESAISDIEINNVEINGPTSISIPGHKDSVTFGQIFNIAYKICGHSDEEIVISTTRPETLLGDVAIAVNPYDEKYIQFQNKNVKFWQPFRKVEIPLIFDENVDRNFGTGALKITPAHDRFDFEIAQRHSLPCINIFDKKGRILKDYIEYKQLPRYDCRDKILKDLMKMNLLRSVKPHKMILPVCSRSNDVIEYIMLPHWYMKCKEMANLANEAIQTGRISIHPKFFEHEWFKWLSDIKDWNISRQLWWGHQIPAYKVNHCNESIWIAAKNEKEAYEKAIIKFGNISNLKIERDSDVLDTWFSSALLPFSAFGWPDKNFQNFYPLDVMETGHDILFFWVARMVMLGIKLTENIPFKNILLNGIICDAHGRKMSKSLGNVIIPKQIIEGASFQAMSSEIKNSFNTGVLDSSEYSKSINDLKKNFPNGIPECGTDALRFTLCSYNFKTHFIKFDVAECHSNKLFFNKIWQASRFTLNALDTLNINLSDINLDNIHLSAMDKWILGQFAKTKSTCIQNYQNYNFHHVAMALKTFFYNKFCNIYLETTKSALSQNSERAAGHCLTLILCLTSGLKLMAPITPFLSNNLLEILPKLSDKIDYDFANEEIEDEVDNIINICATIRQQQSKLNITKKHSPKLYLFPRTFSAFNLLVKFQTETQALSNLNDITVFENDKVNNHVPILYPAGHLCAFGFTTSMPYSKDSKFEEQFTKKKLEKLEAELEKLTKMISNEGYRKAVHKAVHMKHLQRVVQLKEEIENMRKTYENK